MSSAPVQFAVPARAAIVVVLALLALIVLAPPAHAAAAPTLGIHDHILWDHVDAAQLEHQLDESKAAGAQIIRVDVGWASLELEGKGKWSLGYRDRLDNLVTQAERRKLKLLLTFIDAPCWASSAPESLKQGCQGPWWERGVDKYTPTNPRDYADAFATMVKRYGSRVAAWEIGNEPNSPDYYKSPAPARDYVAIVKAAYRAAKAANPRVTIVAGAVMQSDYEFTEKLYREGIKGYFDAFSIHPYCEDRSPSDPWLDEWMRMSFIRGVPKVRAVMRSHGDSRPMWLTEFGWSTSTIRNEKDNGVSEATQALDVTDAIRLAARWDYVKTVIHYNLVNTHEDRSSLYGNYGLLRFDGSRKPAFTAFRNAARELRAATAASQAAAGRPSSPQRAGTAPERGGNGVAARNRAAAKRRRSAAAKRGGVAVRRVRGGLRIAGSAAPRARVYLAIFRVRRGRAAPRPALRRGARANAAGRFRLVVRDQRLTRGSWRVKHSSLR
jgi:hypothetical protein